MKLFTASASPFANKVRMAAQLAGIDLEPVAINAAEEPTELTSANPLGKIPCLVLDNGKAVYDSRAITRHLHYRFETSLYPDDSKPEAADVAVFEALCDGICDCAVAWQYETRLRPEEKVHQPWLDKQWGKVMRGLEEAKKTLPPIGEEANMSSVSLAATLGYLQLRFPGKWESGNEVLVDWINAFDAAHPDVAALKPFV